MLRAAEEKKQLQEKLIQTQTDSIRTLDLKVKEKTRDIREILTHLPQGVFTIDRNLSIGDEHSPFLSTLTDLDKVGGSHLKSTILDQNNLSEDAKSQILAALGASYDDDVHLGWGANCNLLRTEFEMSVKDEQRNIEAEWDPIVDDKRRSGESLVTLRDVTEIRQLQAFADEKRKESAMLWEMLGNDLNKTGKFCKALLRFGKKSTTAFPVASKRQRCATSFLENPHVERQCSFSQGYLAPERVHEVEGISKVLNESHEKDFELFLASSDHRILLTEYKKLYEEKRLSTYLTM